MKLNIIGWIVRLNLVRNEWVFSSLNYIRYEDYCNLLSSFS